MPQLGGLNDGHRHFNCTGLVHLVAHDGLDLANHAHPHRHVVVNARAQLFDQTGARHQLVAGDFCVGRGFFQGGNVKLLIAGIQILVDAHNLKMESDGRWESDANSIKNTLLVLIRKGDDDTKSVLECLTEILTVFNTLEREGFKIRKHESNEINHFDVEIIRVFDMKMTASLTG